MADDILEIIEIGLTLRLVELGKMEQTQAEKLVTGFIEDTRESYGGVRYMIRRGYRRYPPALIAKIRKRYNGRNEKELCGHYGMSRATFYRLIKK